MNKRIVHMEVDERTWVDTNGINSGLGRLATLAEDSYDFEDLLSSAIQSLYRAQPDGAKNYGGKKPSIGRVWINRANVREGYGHANVEYTPSKAYEKQFKYIQKPIAKVDLRARTYDPIWDGNHDAGSFNIPEALMRDLERVMECLGLARADKG